jgi:probable addiction module antidote protein
MKRQADRMTKLTASESHDEVIRQRLRESQRFVIQYLKTALENDEYPGAFLIALRRAVVARGVLTKAAKAAGIERESLYRALSAKGNPRMSTLVAVTRAMGLRITVENLR